MSIITDFKTICNDLLGFALRSFAPKAPAAYKDLGNGSFC